MNQKYIDLSRPSPPSGRVIKKIDPKKPGVILEVREVSDEYPSEKNEEDATQEEYIQYQEQIGAKLVMKGFEEDKSDDITKKQKYNRFIFDEDQVLKKKDFAFLKFNKTAGFGLFLPKDHDVHNKKGKYVKTEQIESPVIIGADHNLYEIGETFEQKYKIKVDPLPAESNWQRRWSLESIRKFIYRETEPVDGKKLFEEIKEIYKQFMYFSCDQWYSVHALWDIGTYFFLNFKYYALMELRGLHGAGKSKVMTISRLFTFNATEEMTNPSEPTLFRETHDKRPTKYIDEAEKLFMVIKGKVEADSRAELINSGYKYTGTVPRQDKIGTRFVTVYYKTYSPSMICSINGLFGATEDRAIVHIMTRAPKDDKRSKAEPEYDAKRYQEIRDRLYIYALENWEDIADLGENLDIKTELDNRALQIWKPLLCIAKHMDDTLYEKVKEFAEQCNQRKSLDTIPEGSLQFKILKIVNDMLNQGIEPILVNEISSRFPDEYKPSNRTISRHLDNLGFAEVAKHHEKGKAYDISMDLFKSIVMNTCPSIFSSVPSEPSGLYIKYENITDETLTESDGRDTHLTKLSSGCQNRQVVKPLNSSSTSSLDETDETDGNIQVSGPKKITHHKCYICQESPCIGWHKNKPVCSHCKKQLEGNGEVVEA